MRTRLLLALTLGVAALAAEPPVGPADPAASANRRRDRSAPAAETQSRTLSASGDSIRVHVPQTIRNRSVVIANVGSDIVVNPRLIANGKRNWFSTPDILSEILAPGMSDRDKALAIWRFLVDNRYHDTPAHGGIEMHDPVRFLNVYGYGFCDDSATNFMVLAEQAGIKARVWGLSGHVVPEAYFEGGWRVLDPDGQIYYLEDDGHAIAGVKTLEQRPDLFRKYPSPYYTNVDKLAALYTTAADNRVAEWYREKSEAVHTLAFTLRPGESLARHHDNWGLYFTSRDPFKTPRDTAKEHYGNGTFVFEPVFENDTFKKGAESVRNLHGERADSTWVLASGNHEGALVYRFASPYPYLDGSVKIRGNGRVGLAFSETGKTWTDLWMSLPDATVDTTVRIGGYLHTRTGNPTYAYYLQLTLDGQIQALRVETDIQVAPRSLPALEPGDNTVRYVDDTEGERRVNIVFGHDFERP